jgi:hypothetical protein
VAKSPNQLNAQPRDNERRMPYRQVSVLTQWQELGAERAEKVCEVLSETTKGVAKRAVKVVDLQKVPSHDKPLLSGDKGKE